MITKRSIRNSTCQRINCIGNDTFEINVSTNIDNISGKFVLSKVKDIAALCDEIAQAGLTLKIAYDVPQIYTAYNAKTEEKYISLLEETKPLREFIGGVHLWGKSISSTGRKIAHCGDLNSYFGDLEIKEHFLLAFKDCFEDGVSRKMVLEVNSGNNDLQSIVTDLRSVGICFV